MNNAKSAVALLALAGLSSITHAQGVVQLEVSQPGAESWGSSINAAPGQSVDVRVKVSYSGTATPLGLASMYIQPTISNWRNTGTADSLSSFVSQGSNISSPAGGVPNVVGQFGRITPYANRSTSGSNFGLTGFVQTVSSTTYLRIAQAYATDWVGTGFNATGGRGIPLSQVNNVGRTTSEPSFSSVLTNIVLFKFRITLSPDQVSRNMEVTIPALGFGNLNTSTNVREIRWFASMTEATGSIVGGAAVVPANIVIPAPASIASLSLAGLCIARRRRR